MVDPSITETDVMRFWAKTRRDGSTGCLEWTAGRTHDGYGIFDLHHRQWRAHRLSWVITFGDIPADALVLHACDTPACVEPSHLFLGDHRANMEDMTTKGRQARGERHFSRAHPELLARGDKSGARKHPEQWKRGESHYKAKLTDNDVRRIRAEAVFGRRGNIAILAAEYDVDCVTIRRVVARQGWRHVG